MSLPYWWSRFHVGMNFETRRYPNKIKCRAYNLPPALKRGKQQWEYDQGAELGPALAVMYDGSYVTIQIQVLDTEETVWVNVWHDDPGRGGPVYFAYPVENEPGYGKKGKGKGENEPGYGKKGKGKGKKGNGHKGKGKGIKGNAKE